MWVPFYLFDHFCLLVQDIPNKLKFILFLLCTVWSFLKCKLYVGDTFLIGSFSFTELSRKKRIWFFVCFNNERFVLRKYFNSVTGVDAQVSYAFKSEGTPHAAKIQESVV